MEVDTSTILILVIVVVVVFLFVRHCMSSEERYGQDASIRATAGWLAGPKGLYGYDPIDHFAAQIALMKARERGDAGIDLMSDPGQLVMSPNKQLGPFMGDSVVIERHPPWKIKLEEGFEYPEENCKSCMTTEEFEHAES